MWARHLWILLCALTLDGFCPQGGRCLTNVSLVIVPPQVQRGQHVALLCQYDLEGAPLYSVKWYRGRHEFYRYSPSEQPPTKVFAFAGVHVDLSVSNETLVLLRKVGFNLSGRFSCEVTVDAPTFATRTVSEALLVVAVPEGPPQLHTDKDRYDVGDVLRANCTSPPSKPAASITFLLNDVPVGGPETTYFKGPEPLEGSRKFLAMRLFPSHFSRGQLALRCTAYIATMYRQSAEARFGGRASDPVPERVTSPNRSPPCSTPLPVLLLLFVLCCQISR
ncbi:uncharacterized protein LOC134542935 [Bacillus rossius redtenbacheri]|uniref:uncharacterized protein LOC134542935 n=1 Tax=Bacillus rossius redtenbacheri TaxID=93214 RepID=UPI002FDDF8B5